MTPSERRTAALKLLAHLDQQIAECLDVAAQPILSYDEVEYLAIQLKFRQRARKRVESMLENLG